MNELTSLSQQTTYIDAQGKKPMPREFKPTTTDRLKLKEEHVLGFSLLAARVVEMRLALELAIQHANEAGLDEAQDDLLARLQASDLPHYRGQLGSSIDPEPSTSGHDSVTKAA